MQMRVERLVHGLLALDAVPLERIQQLAFGQCHAFQKALEGGVALGGVSRNRADGALEIVSDGDDVAGQPRDSVFCRLLLLAFGALADVLDLGVRPQPLVLEVGGFGLEGGNDVVHRPCAVLGAALRGRVRLGCWIAGCARVAFLRIGIVWRRYEPSLLPASVFARPPRCVLAERPGRGDVQDYGHIGQGTEKIKSARDR